MITEGGPNQNSSTPGAGQEKKTGGDKEVRVLLAEDDARLRLQYRDNLATMGCDVEAVKNGLDLLEKLETKEFDLVVTDNQMPFKTGLEALRAIRANEKTKNLPVIVITLDDAQGEVEELGGVYVSKSDFPNFWPKIRAEVEKIREKIREIKD